MAMFCIATFVQLSSDTAALIMLAFVVVIGSTMYWLGGKSRIGIPENIGDLPARGNLVYKAEGHHRMTPATARYLGIALKEEQPLPFLATVEPLGKGDNRQHFVYSLHRELPPLFYLGKNGAIGALDTVPPPF